MKARCSDTTESGLSGHISGLQIFQPNTTTAESILSRVSHIHPSDIRGLSRLTVDAVTGITGLVEHTHHTLSRAPGIVSDGPEGRTRGIAGLVYRSINGVTGLVGGVLDLSFRQLVPLFGQPVSSPQRETALAALNGVLGDHLAATDSPLAISMSLRCNGRTLISDDTGLAASAPRPSPRLLITVHGLCMNDLHWNSAGDDRQISIPARLADALGHTRLDLHYNSGRSISANGRAFADLLETLTDQWPVAVEEIVILAHSMGGLVARSACHYAELAGHRWPRRLRRVVFIGTPHHGSPLERIGNRVERLLRVSPYSAPFSRLGRIRSAGIIDLRHGNLLDREPNGTDDGPERGQRQTAVKLPGHVVAHAIAGSLASNPSARHAGMLGDGLVPIDSALGRHEDPQRRLAIEPHHQTVFANTGHLQLLRQPAVYHTIRDWMA